MAEFTLTYNSLVDLLEAYVEDASAEFASAVNGCINRAEERVFRDLDLSLFNTYASTSLANGVATFTKTSDMKQSPILNIFVTVPATHVERRSYAYIQAHGGSGVPQFFAESDTTVYFAPTPDSAYAVVVTYNKRWTPLASGTQTNWVTDNAADLLMWAALIESESFLIAPERVQEFEGKYRLLLGPVRAFWRGAAQTGYEPVNPTPTPQQTR